ncbi:MAG TPA: hypothetical protein VMA83_11675 [Solirubrobacteraceae bacterium]|nr:hypothetical protein [Solirubrobacteraceae bacterium]
MTAPADGGVAKRLRSWWLTPQRRGTRLLIIPLEYRHLRAFGTIRLAFGVVAAAAGAICLAYSAFGWGAFFLAVAVLDIACGYWYLTIIRSPER